MKTKITKQKVTITLTPEVIDYLSENFENKSKYVECIIYKDMKDNNLIKNDIYLYDKIKQ